MTREEEFERLRRTETPPTQAREVTARWWFERGVEFAARHAPKTEEELDAEIDKFIGEPDLEAQASAAVVVLLPCNGDESCVLLEASLTEMFSHAQGCPGFHRPDVKRALIAAGRERRENLCPHIQGDHCELAEVGLRVLEAKWKDAERTAGDWRQEYEMFARAWQRELGVRLIPKGHLIDSLVLTTQKVVKDRDEALAEVKRLSATKPEQEGERNGED